MASAPANHAHAMPMLDGRPPVPPSPESGSNGTVAEPHHVHDPPVEGDPADLSDKAHLLRDSIAPLDSYTEDGVYWADLPRAQRWKWVRTIDAEDSRETRRMLWAMFKEDPLSPLRAYWNRYCLTGMGLFVEGFTLFSIGNLSSLFQAVWPQCWSKYTVCSHTWVSAVDYLEIIGIICGQILVGIEGDWIGRRFGMVQDAVVMSLGTLMLIAAWGTSLNGWVICYAWSLWFYGVGVGGEYPMTSTRAMEGSGRGRNASTGDKLHRGRNVQLAFLMQGWGQLFNQVVLIVLLLVFHSQGGPPYKETSTQWTYRVSFAAILPFTLYLVYYRLYKVRYADAALSRAKQRLHTSGYDMASLRLVMGHYWPRLIATAGGWFANDFFFYGNKIFQGQFIKLIAPKGSTSVMYGWLYNLINIGCSLVGYYLAAAFIDNKFYGRRRMQSVGFLADFICFIIPAALYDTLLKPGAGLAVFQFLYFFSSFWNQFGPNATTFLVAAECYPASVRATAHGFSAAWGKLGALAPAVLYNYITPHQRFWVVPWFGLLGVFVTEVFLPDTTGLDLREQERYWAFVRAGRAADYRGVAVHPRHLSRWEIFVMKRHLRYDAAADRAMKIDELREVYERLQAERGKEYAQGQESEVDPDEASFVSADVASYFEHEKASRSAASLRPNVGYRKEAQAY